MKSRGSSRPRVGVSYADSLACAAPGLPSGGGPAGGSPPSPPWLGMGAAAAWDFVVGSTGTSMLTAYPSTTDPVTDGVCAFQPSENTLSVSSVILSRLRVEPLYSLCS